MCCSSRFASREDTSLYTLFGGEKIKIFACFVSTDTILGGAHIITTNGLFLSRTTTRRRTHVVAARHWRRKKSKEEEEEARDHHHHHHVDD